MSENEIFLEYHHFEPLVGKVVRFKGTPFAIPLSKVIKGEKFLSTARRDPFILIWRSPKLEYYMTEGMYECEFEDGPTYKMYVHPAFTPEKEFQDYQAVFS